MKQLNSCWFLNNYWSTNSKLLLFFFPCVLATRSTLIKINLTTLLASKNKKRQKLLLVIDQVERPPYKSVLMSLYCSNGYTLERVCSYIPVICLAERTTVRSHPLLQKINRNVLTSFRLPSQFNSTVVQEHIKCQLLCQVMLNQLSACSKLAWNLRYTVVVGYKK